MLVFRIVATVLVASLALVAPAWADTNDDMRARIELLERELQILKDNLAERPIVEPAEREIAVEEMEEETEEIASAAQQARERRHYGLSSWTLLDKIAGERTVVGGYADIEYRSFEGGGIGKRTFNQQRFVLGTASRLTDHIYFSSELETEKGGPQGNQGDGEIKVEMAWLEYQLSQSLNFRGGIILVPFGRLNVFHDSPILDLTDRPMVNRMIIPTTWSESAMGIHGSFAPTDESILTYELYAMNGFNRNISAANGLRRARGSMTKDNNSNKALVGRVGFSPSLGTEFGLSGYTGKYDVDNRNNLSMVGLDLLHTRGPLEIRGEWADVNIKRDAAAIADGIPAGMSGYYLEAAYHFFPRSLRARNPVRFADSTFTGVLRYGSVDTDKGIRSVNDARRWTIGLNFRPVEPAVFKLEYQFNREAVDEIANDGFVMSAAVAF